MKNILTKYNKCDLFSLSSRLNNLKVREGEFDLAIAKIKEKNRKQLEAAYDKNNLASKGYPEFDVLYDEIEKECLEFNSEDNKKQYIQKFLNKKEEQNLAKMGLSKQQIVHIKQDFFSCSFIADKLGVKTKYGKNDGGYFYHFYKNVAMNIDREKLKSKVCGNVIEDITSIIPDELKSSLLRYEVSFFNAVTESSELMVNYYFVLNDQTKKYLLQFNSDYDLSPLEDLTIYQDEKIKFYSCTHERFNSLNINSKFDK